jgi:hypothetical protein
MLYVGKRGRSRCGRYGGRRLGGEEEDVEDMVFDEMFVRRKKKRRSV